jgi:hypothetical protein
MATKCYGVHFPPGMPLLRKVQLFGEAKRLVRSLSFEDAANQMALFGVGLKEDIPWTPSEDEVPEGISETGIIPDTLPPMSAKGNLVIIVSTGEGKDGQASENQ